METRRLGNSGLMVPVLSLGTGMFVPGDIFSRNSVDGAAADRLVSICIERGANMFDTAHTYWDGHSETLLGAAIKGRRDKVIVSTKAGHPSDSGPNDIGASRHHLTRAVEESLRRLGTDYIDIFQLHVFDGLTPVEETLATLDAFVRAGKIRYVGVSNMPGWALMKSLAAADRYGYPRYVVQQSYYSLIGRDYEWELMPLGLDQGVSAAVWSPLGWGRLTGKISRSQPLPPDSRLAFTTGIAPRVDDELLYRVLEALALISADAGKSIAQVAINWLLQRPTVATVIVGARNEEQLVENLGGAGWALSSDQIAALDAASLVHPSYPTAFYSSVDRHRYPRPV